MTGCCESTGWNDFLPAVAVRIPGPRSLRARFLLVVLGGVLIPLAVVGLWLTRSAARSGEALLRTRLDSALDQVVVEAGIRWVGLRAEMLDIADDSAVQRVLSVTADARLPRRPESTLVVSATGRTDNLGASLASPITLASEPGDATWQIVNAANSVRDAPNVRNAVAFADRREGIAVTVPVYARAGGTLIGRLRSRLTLESLVPIGAGGAAGVGVILHVVDRSTGVSLDALPFDPSLLARSEFQLGDERWLVRRRTLEEPSLTIAATAPLGAYTVPFESAARKGSLVILAVAVGALGVAALLTRRLTQSLEELAHATDAVAGGDLDRRVSGKGDDEVGRVGRAFNAMTESLRITIRQLSQREALVAVGEFAASLAHEVRNPLTSIRIDLQRVEEKLPQDSPLRVQLGRALREVQRLDQTVSGALRIARSGSIASDLVDLRVPLQRAIEVATPTFEQCGGALDQIEIGSLPLPVRGDEAALEQLFLNILLNAAQALGAHGEAGVRVSTENGSAQIDIWDSGAGIPKDRLEKVFDAFFSTKSEGTGLGLSVARQIVAAHGGSIEIDSTVGSGTTVSIRVALAK
ncbi:MAG: ATP-binding protein [Gemmatimonadota bacterium]|nr:ATP-binding protein [Gemmatimonadota bacterium]